MENFARLTVRLKKGDPRQQANHFKLLDDFFKLIGGERFGDIYSEETNRENILLYNIPKDKEEFGILLIDMTVSLNNYIRG